MGQSSWDRAVFHWSVSELCKKCKKRCSQHLLFCPHRNKVETLASRAAVLLTKHVQIHPVVHRRVTGKYMLDEFGGSGFMSKATNHLGLRGYVLDTKFGPRHDVTHLLFSQEFDRTSPLGMVSQQ